MVSLTFENPSLLWLLFAIPLLWLAHFYWLRHTKRKALKFANFRVLKRITGHRLITRNYTVLWIRTAIFFLAILAASQATIWYEGTVSENAFVIAIDTSASMRAEDIAPTRAEAAKTYATYFVDATEAKTSFGIVSFSGVTFIEQIVTEEKAEVKSAIRAIETIDAGGTDIPGALITSTNLLAATDKGKTIILITDGSNTLDTFTSDSIQKSLEYVRAQQVIVHTIGVGTESAPIGYLPSYYNISSVYNQENLEYIANQTGGTFIHATTVEELSSAYEAIVGNSSRALIKRELTPILTLFILLLLFVEWNLISTRFRSIP